MHRISNQTGSYVSFLILKDKLVKAQYKQYEQDCYIHMPCYFPWFFRASMVFCLRKPGLCGCCECHSALARLHPSYPSAIPVSRLRSLGYHQPLSSILRRMSLPWPRHQVLPVLTTTSHHHPRQENPVLAWVEGSFMWPQHETWVWVKKIKTCTA